MGYDFFDPIYSCLNGCVKAKVIHKSLGIGVSEKRPMLLTKDELEVNIDESVNLIYSFSLSCALLIYQFCRRDRMSYRNLIVLFGILFVLYVSPLQANTTWNANSMWIERSGEKSLSLEMAIPDFETPSYLDLSCQIFQLSFDNRLNDQVKLLFEVPFVNAEAESRGDSESETLLGNPYIGFDIASVNPQLSTEVGIRIPVGSDDKEIASYLGALGDMERRDAYISGCLPISARFKYQSNQVDPVAFRLQGGPMIIFNADEYFEDNTEIFLNYGGFIGVKSANTTIMAGMTGLMMVSESGMDFDERTIHFAGATLGINMKNAQLGIYFKVPIDDELLEDALDDVIGLYLTMNL